MLSGIIFVLFILLALLGLPIAHSLIVASELGLLPSDRLGADFIVQQLVTQSQSFPLVAIPFFMLTGSLMVGGKLGQHLIDMLTLMMGRVHGGPAQVGVLSSTIFGGVSGSAVADASAIGSLLIPWLKKLGYPPAFAAGSLAAAATIDILIPPSIPMIIYALVSSASIGALFVAGILPGILYSVAIAVAAYVICRRRGYPARPGASLLEVWQAFLRSFWSLMMPIFILAGIRTGMFNVTECSVMAVLYALVVGGLVYRELAWADVVSALVRTGRATAVLMIVLGGAQVVAWLLAYQNIPQAVADWMLTAVQHPWIFLLVVNILLLLVGTFMENGPALVVLAPVLYPIAAKFGIDPYHFSMIVALNLVLGLVTPPVAISLSIGAVIANAPSREVTREAMPLFGVAVLVLLLVTYVPQISLFIPDLMGIK